MITIYTWLANAVKALEKAKNDGILDGYCIPKREVYYLLSHVLGKNSAYLMAFGEEQLNDVEIAQLNHILEQRLEGRPIAYILGIKEFWSLPLKVSQATLIPRPDTESLIEKILELYSNKALSVLDLGTGTGAIVFALAKERPNWQFLGVDLISDAVDLALENKVRLAQLISDIDRIDFRQSNWFDTIDREECFDIIVSNPPYICESDEHLSQGDVRFEPKTALVSLANGLADLNHITKSAKKHLKKGGHLFLEHGYLQHESVKTLFLSHGYKNIQSYQDYNGKDRITFAQYGGL
ncbi:peptide chain release factor N(5)-glutamine methyltransferase [Thorsellia kenyensis]|uniref:Release factor glutamine methyltransferase n=1 Tax=Thorsellia kenyensis TaxID=1549888 RepID=A0ABV6CBY7_9GAMM